MFKIKLNGETLRTADSKAVNTAVVGFLGVGCFVMLIRLAIFVGLIYIAWHFISKFW